MSDLQLVSPQYFPTEMLQLFGLDELPSLLRAGSGAFSTHRSPNLGGKGSVVALNPVGLGRAGRLEAQGCKSRAGGSEL